MAELLLARCPDSARLQALASSLGVGEPRLRRRDDDCITCGLCARMCHDRMGRAAITLAGRGSARRLEPPYGHHNPDCWSCGACDAICPVDRRVSALSSAAALVPLPNPHNLGLDGRPAIHIAYPQAVPNVPTIDPTACVHLAHGVCGVCEALCEAGAIAFDQQPREVRLEVGAVVLTPGFEPFDPTSGSNGPAFEPSDLGYGVHRNVLTSLEFERLLSASGPTGGAVRRPSDGRAPARLAFIQCVGSRDAERDYCSSVCCMAATKEAILAKEHVGAELECDIFAMDVRAFGKGFEAYYQRALELGVRYIPCRPPRVVEDPATGNLRIEYLGAGDRRVTREVDLVVLSVAMAPPAAAADLADLFGLALDPTGFCHTSAFAPVESGRPGVYVAGAFTGPKDIPEAVMEASGAASQVLSWLSDAKGTQVAPREYPPEIDVAGQEPRVGVFVCHCGTNIGGVVNVPAVAEYAATLPGVAHAAHSLYTCSADTQTLIRAAIVDGGLNRVVVASCTPRTHEPLFRNTLREAGLNPYLFEMANIRDQCSWVHRDHAPRATEKAKDLVRMAVAKARLLEPLAPRFREVVPAALVIGGGLAGMTCALALGAQGLDVHLVERAAALGGNLRRLHYLLDGEDPQIQLARLVEETIGHARIHVHTEARVEAIEGSVGAFSTRVSTPAGELELRHGVVVVATGGREYRPTEHLYGQEPTVLTQLELEARLAADETWLAPTRRWLRAPRGQTVVMIQCVGSRTAERPTCSRVCCTEAIKNALELKRRAPETSVYVLYRDLRVYGLAERYYSEARRRGVAFVRFDGEVPFVAQAGDGLEVEVEDVVLGARIRIPADLVVLSAGVVPTEDAETARLLKVPRGDDGYYLEAHMKLRPVDFATAGVFVCGLAHGTKSVAESVAQAQAAAARASAILSRERLELEAHVSSVDEGSCDGCAYCVDPCPVGAISLYEYMSKGAVKKAVEVDSGLCLGCGSCQATCPKGGVRVRGFTKEQLAAQVRALLEVA